MIEIKKPTIYRIGIHIINANGNFDEIRKGKKIPPKDKIIADSIPINIDNFT